MYRTIIAVLCTLVVALVAAGCGGDEGAGSGEVQEKGGPEARDGETLFEDDFSDPSGRWEISEEDDAVLGYADGGYRSLVGTPGTRVASLAPAGEDLGDVSLEANVLAGEGPDGSPFGLVCRAQDDQNYYSLTVSKDGRYSITKIKDGAPEKGARYLQPSALQIGEASNELRAECVGDALALYANGEKLLELRDDEFPSGGVGLTASAPGEEAGTEALFDDFVVRGAERDAPPDEPSTDPPPNGETVNEDDFSDPESGWDTGEAAQGLTSGYVDGAYEFSAAPAGVITATHLGDDLADVTVEVDVTQTEEPENALRGLVCRSTDGEDAGYFDYVFYVSTDGGAGIAREVAPDGGLDRLVDTRNIAPVNTGPGETNRVRADCVGDRLTLTVNGEKVAEVRDEAISGAGEVGFFIDSSDLEGSATARFDDFVLRRP